MSKGNIGEHQGGTLSTARPRGGNEREHTPIGVFPMFPLPARELVSFIFSTPTPNAGRVG